MWSNDFDASTGTRFLFALFMLVSLKRMWKITRQVDAASGVSGQGSRVKPYGLSLSGGHFWAHGAQIFAAD